MKQISQWSKKLSIKNFLYNNFGIRKIPCYYWMLCLLKIIKPKSLNRCFINWVNSLLPKKADYLLNVKDNHKTLKRDIADYVQDDDLRKTMDVTAAREMNSGRIEFKRAFVTDDIDWLFEKSEWENLACIGAINRQFTNSEGVTSNEWHYYISGKNLTAEELLRHARFEWSVESMHWLLDVHFGEDFCRVNDENIQKNLNMSRKIVLNAVKKYKEEFSDNRPISNILFDCLLDPENIIRFFGIN